MHQHADELLAVAAKWWADQLRGPRVFDAMGHTLPDYETSRVVDDPTGAVTLVERLLTQTQETIPLEHCAAFERELLTILREGVEGDQGRYYPINAVGWGGLYCDYGPDTALHVAAERAGITVRYTTFPIKTNMVINAREDYIRVSKGYGAPWETIYGEEPAE